MAPAGAGWFTRRPGTETDPPALLLAGARRGPLEDSGGFPGYGEDHVEVSEWVADVTGSDDPYDPDLLDIDAANRALASYFKAD